MKKKSFVLLLLFFILLTDTKKLEAQVPEIGFSVVLSGAFLFGPHFGYWLESLNYLEASAFAAYDDRLIVPFAFNGGYSYYFGNKAWQPKLGLQYSVLIAPVHDKMPADHAFISLISFTPGLQYRSKDFHQVVGGQAWVSYFTKEKKVTPIALDLKYGYKF